MAKTGFPAFLALALACIGSSSTLAQQPSRAGEYEFNTYCAVCHGQDGKGGGPFTMLLTKRVPDLTVLTKNNSSRFPAARVYDIIAGAPNVQGHGTREMPIWGDVFNEHALDRFGRNADPADTTAFVKMRINALVGYIERLQE